MSSQLTVIEEVEWFAQSTVKVVVRPIVGVNETPDSLESGSIELIAPRSPFLVSGTRSSYSLNG